MLTPVEAYRRRRRIEIVLSRLSIVPTAMLALMMGSLGVLWLEETRFGAWLLQPGVAVTAAVPAESGIVRDFGLCGREHSTCVVDGDTFWLDGVNIRIADIDTPEIHSPRCPSEAALGRRASLRLVELLGQGPFTLSPADRDEDRYGRKLRVVERDGWSIGAILVAEGLAHEWRDRRGGWC